MTDTLNSASFLESDRIQLYPLPEGERTDGESSVWYVIVCKEEICRLEESASYTVIRNGKIPDSRLSFRTWKSAGRDTEWRPPGCGAVAV